MSVVTVSAATPIVSLAFVLVGQLNNHLVGSARVVRRTLDRSVKQDYDDFNGTSRYRHGLEIISGGKAQSTITISPVHTSNQSITPLSSLDPVVRQ